jgi:acetyl-CoA C-acetyltransferase
MPTQPSLSFTPAAAPDASGSAEVYVLDYVRTARGKASERGALHHLTPLALVNTLQQALLERTGLDPSVLDDVVLGIASQVGEQGANLARTAVLTAGWPASVPGVTLNRFCASGIDAVAFAAAAIRSGSASVVVAGGVESVSRVPIFADRGSLWADPEVIGSIGSVHMGIAADLNATIDGTTREELDLYALGTHRKAAAAQTGGAWDRAIVPVAGLDGVAVTRDELVRPNLTAEQLAGLPAAFANLPDQDGLVARFHPEVGPLAHVHTVGTSPQMADGAALLLLADDAGAAASGLAPRARIVATATAAVDPVIMLTAGQAAVEKVLARAGLSADDIDVFEFAEAFAALCLRFSLGLGVGPDRLNPNGGTMATGHAFGATGAIMVGGCVDELHRSGGRYGVAAVSGAAGLGVAVLVERV